MWVDCRDSLSTAYNDGEIDDRSPLTFHIIQYVYIFQGIQNGRGRDFGQEYTHVLHTYIRTYNVIQTYFTYWHIHTCVSMYIHTLHM